jgi:hypothetical protein
MLAPDRLQAEALAAVALSLGISRVGILVSSDFAEMREDFAIACESIGITVVAAVTFPTNLDLSAVRDRTALDVVAREVQESFTQTNVKVRFHVLSPSRPSICSTRVSANSLLIRATHHT